jgi:hypothetical protein
VHQRLRHRRAGSARAPRSPCSPRAPGSPGPAGKVKPPKPPKPPKVKGMPTDAQLKAELTRGLDQAIAEVEGNPDIPKQLRDGILKTLKEARQSGDPRDLTRLADLARGGWGDELRKAIEDQVEDALKDAGIDADLSARGGSFKIDLGKGGRSWAWNWNHDDDDDDDDGFVSISISMTSTSTSTSTSVRRSTIPRWDG